MTASLALLELTSSFMDALVTAAREAGFDEVVRLSPDEGLGDRRWSGVLVGAGGAEARAVDEVRRASASTSAPLLVVGAELDHHRAAALVRAGAAEVHRLPDDLPSVRAWLEERVQRTRERERAERHAETEARRYDFSAIVGTSAGLRDALDRLARIIPRDGVTVLITGETGTGKELVAQALHYLGPRRAGAFVEVNCAALPASLLEAELFGYERGAFTDARTAKPGLFETAHEGTLFLDEVGDLAPDLQVKLLKVLEDRVVRRLGSVKTRPVDFRLVAATHVDLTEAVRSGRFRRDLFYRLNVVPVHLPPLRERGDDVLLLARHFITATSRRYGLPEPPLEASVSRRLRAHPWPGNVRELRNAVERAVLLGDGRIAEDDLALGELGPLEEGPGVLPFPARLDEIERAAARAAVEHASGNKSAAAEMLGISRTRLYRLLDHA